MCSESAEVVLLRGSGIVAMVYSYIILIFQTISPDNKDGRVDQCFVSWKTFILMRFSSTPKSAKRTCKIPMRQAYLSRPLETRVVGGANTRT